MKTKVCIFDLDGVVVDTAKFHFLAWKELAEKLDYPFSEKENEKLKGVSRKNSLEIILGWAKKPLREETKERLLIEKNKNYLSHVERLTQNDILPGIMDVLACLRTLNVNTAIGSSSKNARYILEKLELTDRFDVIVDGTDVKRGKPDPEVFALGAERLKVNYEECLVIEDAVAGIQAAQKLGMKTIGVGQADELRLADYKFSSLSELSTDLLIKIIAA